MTPRKLITTAEAWVFVGETWRFPEFSFCMKQRFVKVVKDKKLNNF